MLIGQLKAMHMPTDRPAWWRRLELRRKHLDDSVRDVARKTGIGVQTLYNWQQGGRPDSSPAVQNLATYLREDFGQLWAEMRQEPTMEMDFVLRSYAARALSAAYHQSLAQLVDPESPAEVDIADIALRQLRRRFPDAELSARVLKRGRRHRRAMHVAIHVKDHDLKPAIVRSQVAAALATLRLPVSIEHSMELLPIGWRQYPVVLVPVHLRPRTATWTTYPIGDQVVVVLGVWYSGGPDVAAAAADQLGTGMEVLTNAVAPLGPWDSSSARNDSTTATDLERRQTKLAELVTADPPAVAGPFIWANNDVPPVLANTVRQQLATTFRGRLIVLQLDDELMAYAAFRSSTASGSSVQEELDKLQHWQTELLAIAADRKQRAEPGAAGVINVLLHLPPQVRPTVEEDGTTTWPDAVDDLFDLYVDVGVELARLLEHEEPEPGPHRFEAVQTPEGWGLSPVRQED